MHVVGTRDHTLPPKKCLVLPSYDPAALEVSVVQFGITPFTQAHSLVYFDALARSKRTTSWGVLGVTGDTALHGKLRKQHFLYTAVEKSREQWSARMVSVLRDCLHLPTQGELVAEAVSRRSTQLILVGPGDAARAPEVSRHLAGALEKRRSAGTGALPILSCTGSRLRQDVLEAAAEHSDRLCSWVFANVAFPGVVSERTVVPPTAHERDELEQWAGVADQCSVVAEPFSQWVVEDCFAGVRPPLELVGVQYVGNAAPYALRKERLWQGTRAALGYVGALLGERTHATAMRDPLLQEFVRRLMEELSPAACTGTSGNQEYKAQVLERLSNVFVTQRLSHACTAESSTMTETLVPALTDYSAGSRAKPLLTLAVAAWLWYLRDAELDHLDHLSQELARCVRGGGANPWPVLDHPLFSAVREDLLLVKGLQQALTQLSHSQGRCVVTRALA